MKTACAYIRVSTDKQEELSPDSQIRLIKEYAAQHDLHVAQIFVEDSISGQRADNRPKFQRMIAECKEKSHPYDAVLVWKFSRFCRNMDESTYYKSILRKKCNVDVVSVSEPIMDGMYGRLIEMIIEWNDEFYLYNLSGEVKRGMNQKLLKGGYVSMCPIGYIWVDSNTPPKVHPEESQLVRYIFSSFVTDKKSMSAIARELNDKHIFTRKGSRWEIRTIKYVLQNPFYIGKMRWSNGIDYCVQSGANSATIFDASHEAIIDSDIWDAAQDLSRRFSARGVRGASGCKTWLSGIVKCATCGASLGYNTHSTNKNWSYYRCWKSSKGHCANTKSVQESKLKAAVISGLEQVLSSGHCEFSFQPSGNTIDEQRYREDELKKLERKELRVKEAYLNGIDTIDEYKFNKQLLLDERAKLLDLAANPKELVPSKHYESIMIRRISDVVDLLKSDADDVQKGDALRSLVDKIVYDNKADELLFYFVLSL